MLIIGAGMSGLLAANILRKQHPIIIESQKQLPNNHKALLRFRTNSVARSTAIPFKKVRVQKQINHHGKITDKPTISMANQYSYKVTGKCTSRSIWNMDPVERYIAPENFIEQMASGCEIKYGENFSFANLCKNDSPIISTIPMFNLMEILGWEDIPHFEYKSIWSVTFELSELVDLYQTTYYPNPDLDFYRSSITGSKVIFEFINDPAPMKTWKGKEVTLEFILSHFLEHDYGIKIEPDKMPEIEVKFQKYGKLLEIPEAIRKKFIVWATTKHNIYSLGRWATHRQLLMDDVVQDVEIISNLINNHKYHK